MKKLLAAAVILAFFSLLSVGNPADALDREPGFYLAQTSEESSAEKEEYDDEEYDDEGEEVVELKKTHEQLYNENRHLNDELQEVFRQWYPSFSQGDENQRLAA